jgi:hypothetical protein
MTKRLTCGLYMLVCDESYYALVVCKTSFGYQLSSSLLAFDACQWPLSNRGTCICMFDMCGYLFFSSPLSLSLIGFHANSSQNNYVFCHFIFMLDLVIIILIIIYFVLDPFFFKSSLNIILIGDWAMSFFLVCLLWGNNDLVIRFIWLKSCPKLTLAPFFYKNCFFIF